ncbi:hypothetical protein RN001_004749 [Aquatica leii]|uniref:Uncharacterized protein n=1 Tax=Aquatica leii TaxID=1421715 RepID=A0AAN7SRV2_9COLE|nr:hypothetical protein RN001_004749 [Aquatica leii]
MANGLFRKSRQILILLFVALVNTSTIKDNNPEFYSLSVLNIHNYTKNNENFKKIEFEVRGRNIYNGVQIKITKKNDNRNSVCAEDMKNYTLTQMWESDIKSSYVLIVENSVKDNIYLCLPRVVQTFNDLEQPQNLLGVGNVNWYHQGHDVLISASAKTSDSGTGNFDSVTMSPIRSKRASELGLHPILDIPTPNNITIIGVRSEAGSNEPTLDEFGVPEMLVKTLYNLRLFGINLNKNMLVAFTENKGDVGSRCLMSMDLVFPVEAEVTDGVEHTNTVKVSVSLPVVPLSGIYYLCVSQGKTDNNNYTYPFIHQGCEQWLKVKTVEKIVPTWAAILIICICLSFSALFSGLNLGLMSIDRTELKILCNTGTPRERSYAKAIQPVRNHGNYLLCSILLGNVFVNSIFTILLDSLTSGVIAVIFSTLAIVMFGEITPQAICSRHGLAVGAKTIFITKFVMVLTAPLSYPISKVLDYILGEEIGNVYNRERLKELLKVTTGENDLDKDEVNIISGALELRKKTVSEVMTRIEDVFMLDYDAILNFETVSEIMKSGYSRIPVFDGNRNNIVTMLYIKDLAFVDPDDNTPLKTLCQFYQNPCNFVFEDVTLDVMFRIFKEGNKGHMAFVHRVNNEGEGDPFYETIGLITLEDVIEELIQAEIMDETDVFTDNRTKRRRNADRTKQDFTVFAERRPDNKVRISPQLTLATFQYLSTSVDLFKPDSISETILRRLLKQEVMFHIKKTKDWRNDPEMLIYQQGKAVDYFVLILEGRVEVTVGRENMIFESGPFTYFGVQALVQNLSVVDSPTAPSTLGSLQSLNMDAMLRHTFQPDYSVRAGTDVLYMKIKRSLYLAAKRATLMERSQRDTIPNTPGDQFDDEVEKLLHSLEDDSSIGRTSPEPRYKQTDIVRDSNATTALSIHSNSKPASPRSITSPTTSHLTTSRDILNGPIKKPSVSEDGMFPVTSKDEKISLLSKK